MNHKSIKSFQKKKFLSIKCRNIYADNIIIYICTRKRKIDDSDNPILIR